MATVKLFGNLREIAGVSTVDIPGDVVAAVLGELTRQYPEMQAALFEEESLRPFVRVVIDGQDSELAQGLQTAVSDSSTVSIFPPLAGGSL